MKVVHNCLVPQAFILFVLAVLGVLIARDSMRLNRWVPEHFREGPVVFRQSRTLVQLPESLPTPEMRSGLFYDTEYSVLGPTEVAFTAQTFNGPLMLGLLEVDSASSTLTATGRLHWTAWSLFLVGFWLVGFPWPLFVLLLALAAANFFTEVRSFRRVLDRVADTVNSPVLDVAAEPID